MRLSWPACRMEDGSKRCDVKVLPKDPFENVLDMVGAAAPTPPLSVMPCWRKHRGKQRPALFHDTLVLSP